MGLGTIMVVDNLPTSPKLPTLARAGLPNLTEPMLSDVGHTTSGVLS